MFYLKISFRHSPLSSQQQLGQLFYSWTSSEVELFFLEKLQTIRSLIDLTDYHISTSLVNIVVYTLFRGRRKSSFEIWAIWPKKVLCTNCIGGVLLFKWKSLNFMI